MPPRVAEGALGGQDPWVVVTEAQRPIGGEEIALRGLQVPVVAVRHRRQELDACDRTRVRGIRLLVGVPGDPVAVDVKFHRPHGTGALEQDLESYRAESGSRYVHESAVLV